MWIIGILLLLIMCLLGYMLLLAKQNNVLYHTIDAKGKDEHLRIFFISDSHARVISERMIKRIKQPIDFVIIGGDFADKRTPIERIEKNLQTLKILGPLYFVWGNNDREVGEERLQQLFIKYDVTVLNNDAQALKSKNQLWLSAIDDTSAKYNIPKALEKCPLDAQVIFVSHNPQIFNRVLPHRHPLLMMGGHLHGGQIRVGKYGMQPHGYFSEEEGRYKLVSNGYGTTLVPMRLGAKPQSHVIHLKFSKH